MFGQIEAAGAIGRTLVVSDNQGTISRFRKASQERSPPPPPLWSSCVIGSFMCCISEAFTTAVPGAAASRKIQRRPVVTGRFVRKAHDRGLRVDVWTIDDEPAMRRLLSLGVDGIMTDRPDVLARVLNGR